MANSRFTAKTYDRWETKTSIVYNGFNLDQFKPTTDKKNRIRVKYGIEHNQPLIGVVGRLTPRKRQIDLIKALPEILEEYPQTQVLLIGSSYEGLGKDYEEKLQAEIDELGLDNSVRITGYVEEIQQHISELDVLVLPSLQEPFGRVIVESLLLETPVIGTNDGGIPEIITDGKSGILIPPKAPKAIAEAVLTYLNNPDKAEQMAKVGRQTVKEKFEARNITKQIEELYDGITE
jgi:glycosyltransferase involved in cell wall biosynthesis